MRKFPCYDGVMTELEVQIAFVLKEACKIAEKNGWDGMEFSPIYRATFDARDKGYLWLYNDQDEGCGFDLYNVIYDKNFNKALWGPRRWKKCLQNMVIADDPIQFIGKVLKL